MKVSEKFEELTADNTFGWDKRTIRDAEEICKSVGIWDKDYEYVKKNSADIKTKINKKLKAYFDNCEYIISILNEMFDELASQGYFINPEKVYNSDEIHVKLLKYLQSGENTKVEHNRDNIASAFGMSRNSVDKRINELLSDDCYIMGTKVKINNIRRKNNTYDSTIHPVFLAMNLTEVYYYTVIIPSLTKGTQYDNISVILAADIYSQLSDYAHAMLDDHIDKRIKDALVKSREYRREDEKEYRDDAINLAYYQKSGKPCSILLPYEDDYISGHFIIPSNSFVCDDGRIINVNPKTIINLKEIQT